MITGTDVVADLRKRMSEEDLAIGDGWKGLMEAAAAGVLDYDDTQELMDVATDILMEQVVLGTDCTDAKAAALVKVGEAIDALLAEGGAE